MKLDDEIDRIKMHIVEMDGHRDGVPYSDGYQEMFYTETSFTQINRDKCKQIVEHAKKKGYTPKMLYIDFTIYKSNRNSLIGELEVLFNGKVTYDASLDRLIKWKDVQPVYEDFAGVVKE